MLQAHQLPPWSWEQLISRHVTVGVICLLVLLGFYLWSIKQANKMIATKQREDTEALLAGVEGASPAAMTSLEGR